MDFETDMELLALQGMFEGGTMANAAIVLALLDAGVIDKGRLLDIIESLHGILAADYVGRLGDFEDAQLALENLRGWLSGPEWRPGQVVEDLRKLETAEFLRSQMMLANSKRRRRPPEGKTD